MKVIMYGSHLCQDVIFALVKLKEHNVSIEFRNISTNFSELKEFMDYRETLELFDEVKKNNMLGIPFFILKDGTKTFDYKEILAKI
ncbi:MAG: glutaredoxin [Clostridia bacterium]